MSNSYRDHTKYGYNHFIHRALQEENKKEVPIMTGVGHYIPDHSTSDLVCVVHRKDDTNKKESFDVGRHP